MTKVTSVRRWGYQVKQSDQIVIWVLTYVPVSVIIPLAANADGEWCNGSTYDSDSYCQGSNPCSPAICLHCLEA